MQRSLPWLIMFPLFGLAGVMAIYAWFSYALTAPNLILSNFEPYWQWQLWMWKTFFDHREALVPLYVWLIAGACSFHLILLTFLDTQTNSLKKPIVTLKMLFLGIFFVSLPLFFSNNALSYDVFNYIFNAKMIWVYQENPHVKVALDFAEDDWLRFMHNTHTPAPYGYGWSGLSLIPYMMGMGKLSLTWVIFRWWSGLSLGLLAAAIAWLIKKAPEPQRVFAAAWLFLNPLLLIEIISNSHNDLWMMVPALAGTALLARDRKPKTIILAAILLACSISIKYASLALAPVWLLLLIFPKHPLQKWWPFLASLLMFLPLLTARSQQFHPWYLTWVMAWIPLSMVVEPNAKSLLDGFIFRANRIWWQAVTILSISSLFRYLPYLQLGEYTPTIISQQKLITWIPFVVALVFFSVFELFRRPAKLGTMIK
jgi:hypothetical protein